MPGRHRAPRWRPASPPTPPHAVTADPPTHEMPVEAPWLRVVPRLDDDEPPAVLPKEDEVTVIYPDGAKIRVPVRNGMVLHLSHLNGAPTIGVTTA